MKTSVGEAHGTWNWRAIANPMPAGTKTSSQLSEGRSQRFRIDHEVDVSFVVSHSGEDGAKRQERVQEILPLTCRVSLLAFVVGYGSDTVSTTSEPWGQT